MSENLIRVFSSVAAEGVPAEVVAKAVQGLARATERMAQNMVENAMALLKENAITVEKMNRSFCGACRCKNFHWTERGLGGTRFSGDS